MRWMALLVIGAMALSTLHYFWEHFPYIGIAAGLGYLCGAMRWRGVRDEQDENPWRHFGGGGSQR